MVSTIQPNSTEAVYGAQAIKSEQTSAKINQASSQHYADSVHLSQAAKAAASQDVDRDADSH